jgi:hypothetical protein
MSSASTSDRSAVIRGSTATSVPWLLSATRRSDRCVSPLSRVQSSSCMSSNILQHDSKPEQRPLCDAAALAGGVTATAPLDFQPCFRLHKRTQQEMGSAAAKLACADAEAEAHEWLCITLLKADISAESSLKQFNHGGSSRHVETAQVVQC